MLETILSWVPIIFAWFVSLFTPEEWQAFALLIAATISATHTFKVLWRLSPLPGGGALGVNVLASILGFVFALLLWPDPTNWIAIGFIAGPASILIFKIAFGFLKRYLPGVARGLNLDRRSASTPLRPVGVHGERRRSRQEQP